MDLLYSRYANPLELMDMYIEQGRFDEFVFNIVDLENKRRIEEAKKDDDNKLWLAYINSMTQKTFTEWKKELKQVKKPKSYSMTNAQVDNAIQDAKGILKRISPV